MWFGGNTAVMNNATKLENSERKLVHHALMLTEPFTGLLSVSLGTRADTVRVLNTYYLVSQEAGAKSSH